MKPYGSFYLDPELIRRYPDAVAEAFWRMKFVPFRAEYLYSHQRIFYTGISPEFVDVPDTDYPPEYQIKIKIIDKAFQGLTIKGPGERFISLWTADTRDLKSPS